MSCLLGYAGAWFMSCYAYQFGLLDIPNGRSSHSLPTPRGGGVGILVVFVVSSLLLKLALGIWLPAAFLALVSFFDDKLNLSPRTRLVFQFTASMVMVGSFLIGYGGFPLTIQNSSLTVVLVFIFYSIFVVGTANFYNFMDGINGIAGITGAIGFGLLGIFAVTSANMPTLGLSALCISAACTGFLPLNIPRARVFMGDVGSILLGFVFASFVVVMARSVADFLLLAGFLSTFYADTLVTLYVRKKDGERLSQAHRRHLYQLFANQKQVLHWKVSCCYGIIQLITGFMAILARSFGLIPLIMLQLILGSLFILISFRIRSRYEIQT